MKKLKYGDNILVLGSCNVRRGIIEETTGGMNSLTGLYYVKISEKRSLAKLDDIFPDTKNGKKELINVIENRIISLEREKDQMFKELCK